MFYYYIMLLFFIYYCKILANLKLSILEKNAVYKKKMLLMKALLSRFEEIP